jgi:hypothetical protein
MLGWVLLRSPDLPTHWATMPAPRGDVPGTTPFVTDSRLASERDLVTPWFEDSIWLDVVQGTTQLEAVGTLPPVDRVVVEVVERNADDADLAGLLDAVAAHLPG